MGLDLTINDYTILLSEIDEIQKRHGLLPGAADWVASNKQTVQEWLNGNGDVEDALTAVYGLWSVVDNEHRRESSDARIRKSSSPFKFQPPAEPHAADRWIGLIRAELEESQKHSCSLRMKLIAEQLLNAGVSEAEYEQMWREARELNVLQIFYETYGLPIRPRGLPVPTSHFHRWTAVRDQIDVALTDIKNGKQPRKTIVNRVTPVFPVTTIGMKREGGMISITASGKAPAIGLWLNVAAFFPDEPYAVETVKDGKATFYVKSDDVWQIGVAAIDCGAFKGPMHVQPIGYDELKVVECDHPQI